MRKPTAAPFASLSGLQPPLRRKGLARIPRAPGNSRTPGSTMGTLRDCAPAAGSRQWPHGDAPSPQIYGRGTCSDIYNHPFLFYGRGSANSHPPPTPGAPSAAPSPFPLKYFIISRGIKFPARGNANSLPGPWALKLYAVRLMGCRDRPLVQVPFRSHHAAGSTISPFE